MVHMYPRGYQEITYSCALNTPHQICSEHQHVYIIQHKIAVTKAFMHQKMSLCLHYNFPYIDTCKTSEPLNNHF